MPDDTPQQPPDLFVLLGDLRLALTNASQVTTYALDLKASADRLLPLVGNAGQAHALECPSLSVQVARLDRERTLASPEPP